MDAAQGQLQETPYSRRVGRDRSFRFWIVGYGTKRGADGNNRREENGVMISSGSSLFSFCAMRLFRRALFAEGRIGFGQLPAYRLNRQSRNRNGQCRSCLSRNKQNDCFRFLADLFQHADISAPSGLYNRGDFGFVQNWIRPVRTSFHVATSKGASASNLLRQLRRRHPKLTADGLMLCVQIRS